MKLEIETILREKWPDWHLVEVIGEGANATVYKAQKEDAIGITYSAIKVLCISKTDNIDSYTREIMMMESLKGYTNIVCIEDYIIVDTAEQWYIFIRMELLTPLDKAEDEFDESRTIQLGIELCEALELCQKKQIVHLDIKPSNIFINSEGKFKLGDFGVSLHAGESILPESSGFTLNFMAPELYHSLVAQSKTNKETAVCSSNDSIVETKYDLYSLGLVLYWLRNSHQLPFLPHRLLTDQDRIEAFKQRINGANLPPLKGTTPYLSEIIMKACSADPKERFNSPKELSTALQSIKGLRDSQPNQSIENQHHSFSAKILLILFSCAILLFICIRYVVPTFLNDWSEWSEWTENRQEEFDPNYVQEDVREQQRWWAAQCTTCGTNNPYHGSSVQCKECGTTLYNDKNLWKSVFAYSDDIGNTQTIYGRELGRLFDGQPYWYNKSVILYRYRTRKTVPTTTGNDIKKDLDNTSQSISTTDNTTQWRFTNGTLYISGQGDMDDYPYPKEPPWNSIKQSVTSIVVEEGVTSIGERAFFDYDELIEVILPSTLKRINANAFMYCDKLTKLIIPEGVEAIGESIIYRNPSLTEICLPKTLKLIEGSFAGECPKLAKISLSNENASYRVIDGVLFDYSAKELICHPAGLNDTTYTIPDTVTTVAVYAFAENQKLIEIAIPHSVKSIKACAFSGCTNLRNLYIPDCVTIIEHYAFYNCERLESIHLSSNITKLYQQVFDGCASLKTIVIPDSVKTITGGSVFGNCTSLEKIIIPSSVLTISSGTFQGSPDVVIYCEENSYAEQFANENNIAFENISFPYDSDDQF